jgi:hypothetical protein
LPILPTLAERLRFLTANPSIREAAGRVAKKRISDHYRWQKVASDIEKVYFDLLSWQSIEPGVKKPSASAVAGEKEIVV